jgi:hypothetical protein
MALQRQAKALARCERRGFGTRMPFLRARARCAEARAAVALRRTFYLKKQSYFDLGGAARCCSTRSLRRRSRGVSARAGFKQTAAQRAC